MSWTDDLTTVNWVFFVLGCLAALFVLFCIVSYVYIKVKFKNKRELAFSPQVILLVAGLGVIFFAVALGLDLRRRNRTERLWVDYKSSYDPQEVREFIKQVQNSDLNDTEYSQGEGIGVIVCSGGERTLEALGGLGYLREMEREKGMDPVPIEWYYVGDEMEDATMQEIDYALGNIRFIDVKDEKLKSFAIKPYALTQSNFQHAVLLDSDCVPLRHPTEIIAESDQYKQHGNLFFKSAGGKYKPDLALPEFRKAYKNSDQASNAYDTHDSESGQLIIDRNKWRNALLYTWKLNENMELTYKVTYGDKDTFIIGFVMDGKTDQFQQMSHKPKTLVAPKNMDVKKKKVAFVHFDQDKRPIFFHRHGQKGNCEKHNKMCFTQLENFEFVPDNLKIPVQRIGENERFFAPRIQKQ